MASQQFITTFDNLYKQWKAINFANLYRENLGTESLTSVKPIIENISKRLDQINSNKNVLSNNLLSSINQFLANAINQINGYMNINNHQFIAQKNQIIQTLNSIHEHFNNIWPSVFVLLYEGEMSEIKKDTDKIKSLNREIEEFKNKLQKELEDFENRYKKSFQIAEGEFQRQSFFERQSENYYNNSKIWLYTIIGISVILIGVIILLFHSFCFEYNCFINLNFDKICLDCNRMILYLEIFKSIAIRLFCITFLIYLLSFCISNYKACMHNYTINKHKANSLDAALRLLERAYSEKAKDQIIIQVCNSIFTHQNTGYSSKDPKNMTNVLSKELDELVSQNIINNPSKS